MAAVRKMNFSFATAFQMEAIKGAFHFTVSFSQDYTGAQQESLHHLLANSFEKKGFNGNSINIYSIYKTCTLS